jgi:cysteine dioxygenase
MCDRSISWTQLLERLEELFEDDEVNVDLVMDLFETYKSNQADWKKYTKFDTHRYTRNLVSAGNGKYNLMLLCWGEGMGSSIHDHADAHCFVKILDGALREVQYDWPKTENADQPLVEKCSGSLSKNSVTYINDSIGLHRVENSSHTDPAVSLHCYIPPFEACHAFNQQTGHRTRCKVTFWSKFGERTKFKVPDSAVLTDEEKRGNAATKTDVDHRMRAMSIRSPASETTQ